MKNFILVVLTVLPLVLYAQPQKGQAYWLDKLDESLDRREQLEKQKTDKINSLKKQLKSTRANKERYRLSRQLYDEYKTYRYDSAVVYVKMMDSLARQINDRSLILESQCANIFCMTSAGILSEAHTTILAMDTTGMDIENKKEYYKVVSIFWRSLADYVKDEPYYTKYITQSNACLDSLKKIIPKNSTLWHSYSGSHLMREWKFREALDHFDMVMKAPDTAPHLKAMTMAEMAWAYVHLNDEEKAIECFAQSAIYDNETCTREITALYHLSRFIYKQGDYERASRYVHQALKDVSFYNSKLRKIEIGDILPIIEQDRYNALRSERNWLMAAVGLAVLLLIAIVSSYVMLKRKNRKLTEARETIAEHLRQLQQANSQLKEANKIKNEYIGRSFYTNAEFIAKIEKLYLAIDRKIATRQYEDLRSTLKQSTLNAERESMYTAFDQTFLKLFPQFVERYNALFEEKDRKMPADNQSLTSEMRIFALIRLGITDSERIANFLDYSVHTVNTYKTRIKNRSICDNDQFEQRIMEI